MPRWLQRSAAIIGAMFALVIVFFALSGAGAQGLEEQVNTGLRFGTIVGWSTQDLRVTIMRVIQVFLGFLGIIAIIIILYAGWRWMTSGGDPQKIDEAKRTLVNAVIGLLIIFSAFAIVSFIIRALSGATGPQGGARVPPPVLPCTNCGALGGGIIESVYPTPGAQDVPRDTLIFVTFKLPIVRNSIIATDPTGDHPKNVEIAARNATGGWDAIDNAQVTASTNNNLTFVFNPVDYLGNGRTDVIYRVSLGCGINRQTSGAPKRAFGDTCTEPGFAWTFTVGTRLDLIPPILDEVFPPPDDDPDTYGEVSAVHATGALTVGSRPQTAQIARVDELTAVVGPTASFAASAYNCGVDAFVCVTRTLSVYQIDLKPIETTDSCNDPGVLTERGGWLNQGAASGQRAVALGCGVTLGFAADPSPGNQWYFRAYAAKTADTLRIGNGPTYTFVEDSARAENNEIAVGTLVAPKTKEQIAAEIAQTLQSAAQSPDVDAVVDALNSARVKLTAKTAGTAGNQIGIFGSGSWLAAVEQFSGGKNPGFQQTPAGLADVARNAVPRLDFSEAMLPLTITGVVNIDAGADVGSLVDPSVPPRVTVQADLNSNGTFESDEFVAGNFIISNLYQTVEFQAASLCGVCQNSGASCTVGGGDCAAGEACNPIRNSCGDQIFCLPTVKADVRNPGGATRYRMTVRAASLLQCNETDGRADNDCLDPNFPACNAGVCQTEDRSRNYPKAKDPFDGAMDAAQNSLDGNRVSGAQGPVTFYNLNKNDTTKGDNVEWTFVVNNRIDLTPPKITIATGQITPNIAVSGVPIVTSIDANFDKVLLSSSLVPDRGYRDGRCGCRVSGDCKQDQGEECDVDTGTCRSTSGRDNFCSESSVCKAGFACQTQQHVALIDYACQSGGQCTGWWVTNAGRDNTTPPDGFADFTQARLNHTPLAEFTQYGVEMGSGIKDQYQNCFLPSEGPNAGGTACGATRAKPYCCDGVASADPCP